MRASRAIVATVALLAGAGSVEAAGCNDSANAVICTGNSGLTGENAPNVSREISADRTSDYYVSTAGGNARGSSTGENAGAGGAVAVTVRQDVEVDGLVTALSIGGRSAVGRAGNGGAVTLTIEQGANVADATAKSTGGTAAAGLRGGQAGTVTGVIEGTVTGTANFSSTGGNAYANGGTPGNAAAIDVVVASTGKIVDLDINATGGTNLDAVPAIGRAGAVELTIAGEVHSATITTISSTENQVDVVVEGGAVVTGTIAVVGNSDATLTFDMKVSDRREYRAAMDVLLDPTKPAGGSIVVNGKSYSWSGFDHLESLLDYVGTTQPDARVRVIVSSKTKLRLFKAAAAGAFACDSAAVHPVVQADGAVALYARVEGRKGKSLIGVIKGRTFRGSGVEWNAVLEAGIWAVSAPAGSVIARCS